MNTTMHPEIGMRIVLAGLLSLALSVGAADPAPAPGIQFDQTSFDFGKIMSGTVVRRDFTFTNTGTATLEILNVAPHCGCTAAGTWDKKVEPGQVGRIPLQFNSAAFSGPIAKSATVTCNDPAHPNTELYLKGTVWKPIEVVPPTLTFNLNDDATSRETRVVRIVNNQPDPVTLFDSQCTSPFFTNELRVLKPGHEFELHVTVLPPLNAPTVVANISFKTSSTNMPLLSLTAIAMQQPSVSVSPPQISLAAGPLPAPVTSVVTIRNTSSNLLELADAAINIPEAKMNVFQPVTGRVFNVALTFPAGLELRPDQKFAFTARTTNPKHPLITVPVLASQPPVPSPVPSPVPAPFPAGAGPGPAPIKSSP